MTDTTEDDVVIERRFAAPVDVVWAMWTEPDHLKAWYGPTGAVLPVVELDVRVGGVRRVCMEMQTPDGVRRMWFVGEFQEVVPNARLVYTESMSDGAGNLLSPADLGMPEGHPVTTVVHVELKDLGGRTRLELTHEGVAPDSPGALGWTMALDELAARVEGPAA